MYSENQLNLNYLSKQFGESEVESTIKSTGIEKIRIADDGACASDLYESAAKHLMNEINIYPKYTDGLIFVSETPDYGLSGTSLILQHKLELPTSSIL